MFMRLVKINTLFSGIYEFAVYYFGPLNFTYFFNFGLLALVCLVMQIITDFFWRCIMNLLLHMLLLVWNI
jgi:quinol-cytochrome oxidoreductase complex cytochrome b subunit